MNAVRPGFPAGNRFNAAIVDADAAIVEVITSLERWLTAPAGTPQLIPARAWTGRR